MTMMTVSVGLKGSRAVAGDGLRLLGQWPCHPVRGRIEHVGSWRPSLWERWGQIGRRADLRDPEPLCGGRKLGESDSPVTVPGSAQNKQNAAEVAAFRVNFDAKRVLGRPQPSPPRQTRGRQAPNRPNSVIVTRRRRTIHARAVARAVGAVAALLVLPAAAHRAGVVAAVALVALGNRRRSGGRAPGGPCAVAHLPCADRGFKARTGDHAHGGAEGVGAATAGADTPPLPFTAPFVGAASPRALGERPTGRDTCRPTSRWSAREAWRSAARGRRPHHRLRGLHGLRRSRLQAHLEDVVGQALADRSIMAVNIFEPSRLVLDARILLAEGAVSRWSRGAGPSRRGGSSTVRRASR